MTPFPTGSPALDSVLGGGIPAAATLLIAGLPGTGKTILAEQVLFANASAERPAVYLTTLSEPLDETIRYLQQFAFFDPARLPGVIHYQDIGQAIRERGVAHLAPLLEDLIVERNARFLVIDSFKALHDLSVDSVSFRTALFDVARVLAAGGVTALLLGEYSPADIASLPEFAVADGILELSNRAHGVRDERTLRVHKMRGSAHLPGEHSFRIDRDGLKVFPRPIGTDQRGLPAAGERRPTGLPDLDALMEGGLFPGSATLVAGPSGVGKTMLGLRYLLAGAHAGEAGLLVSFQESRAHIERAIRGFELDELELERQGLLRVLYVSPLELDLVEVFGQLTQALESGHARRLVVDPIDDMREAAIERSRFRATIWSLVRYLDRGGVTALLLTETPFGQEELHAVTREEISYMADNLLVLRYLRPPRDGYDRILEVVKTRGSGHVAGPQLYRVGPSGPILRGA